MATNADTTLKDSVQAAINDIRPSLQADGGDIDLVSVDDEGIVSVKLTGACAGCPMSQITLSQGVERHLKSIIPEVTSVVAV